MLGHTWNDISLNTHSHPTVTLPYYWSMYLHFPLVGFTDMKCTEVSSALSASPCYMANLDPFRRRDRRGSVRHSYPIQMGLHPKSANRMASCAAIPQTRTPRKPSPKPEQTSSTMTEEEWRFGQYTDPIANPSLKDRRRVAGYH